MAAILQDDIFKRIFLNQNVRIPINISLEFVPKGPFNNSTALVQIMAWRRPSDKPLCETMLVSLLTHICVTRPQWVNEATLIGVSEKASYRTTITQQSINSMHHSSDVRYGYIYSKNSFHVCIFNLTGWYLVFKESIFYVKPSYITLRLREKHYAFYITSIFFYS